uniref:Solute carrier family 66 member 2 n=1 Tax=Romanomermis culicivorax TaxID=13658 RepID=A0A915I6H6_ROMCU
MDVGQGNAMLYDLVDHVYTLGFLVISVGIMFGGIIPYYFQYREINRNKNAGGFSLFVCFNLLTSNILRVFFWFGKKFETQLLVQSIVMILCMLCMIYSAVKINSLHILPPNKRNSIWDGDLVKNFWNWNDFSSYLLVVSVFSFVGLSVTYMMFDVAVYHEIMGFFALFLEAMVVTPQLIRNFRRKTTKGLSAAMIFTLLIGDLCKTGYFVVRQAPLQFPVCGFLQISIDIAILLQIYFYRTRAIRRTSDAKFAENLIKT